MKDWKLGHKIENATIKFFQHPDRNYVLMEIYDDKMRLLGETHITPKRFTEILGENQHSKHDDRTRKSGLKEVIR